MSVNSSTKLKGAGVKGGGVVGAGAGATVDTVETG